MRAGSPRGQAGPTATAAMCKPRIVAGPPACPRSRGVALVTILAVLTILALLAAMLAMVIQLEASGAAQQQQQLTATLLLNAGLAHAEALLNSAPTFVQAEVMELINVSPRPISLKNWTLTFNSGSITNDIGQVDYSVGYGAGPGGRNVNPTIDGNGYFYLVNNMKLFNADFGTKRPELWGQTASQRVPIWELPTDSWGVQYEQWRFDPGQPSHIDTVTLLGMPAKGGIVSMTLKNEHTQIAARTVEYAFRDEDPHGWYGQTTEKQDPTHYLWTMRRTPSISGNSQLARHRAVRATAGAKVQIKNGPFNSVAELRHVRHGEQFENIGEGYSKAQS